MSYAGGLGMARGSTSHGGGGGGGGGYHAVRSGVSMAPMRSAPMHAMSRSYEHAAPMRSSLHVTPRSYPRSMAPMGPSGGATPSGGAHRLGGGMPMRGPGGGAGHIGGGGGVMRHGNLAPGHHGGGHPGNWRRGRRWGRRGRGGWGGGWWGGGWGYPVYDSVLAYDPCEECWDLPPYTYAYDRCVIENGCRTPLLGVGQAPASAQDVVNRTTGMIAGTIAGGVIGLGVGVVGLGWLAYYMFVGRHKRVRRNRRRRSR